MSNLSRYQRQQKGGTVRVQGMVERTAASGQLRGGADRTQSRLDGDSIDEKFGFHRFKEGSPRLGWLLNYMATSMPDETGLERSGLDLYFIDRSGQNFKASVFYDPYFYLDLKDMKYGLELSQHLTKRFEGSCRVEVVEREDLDLPNHLSGLKHSFLKIIFGTVSELMDAKAVLKPIIAANKKRLEASEYYDEGLTNGSRSVGFTAGQDPLSVIVDLREYDVPYTVRVAIDLDLRVGAWYNVEPLSGSEVCNLIWQKDMLELCEPKVLAFDIECEKAPLKFPNAEVDRCFMISYMFKGQGFLVINREIVSEDVKDFEYTPMPKYPGPFQIFNEQDEKSMLQKFIFHVQELKPHVIVTYNGDFFDWPYVDRRCKKHGINLYNELGIRLQHGPGQSSVPKPTENSGGSSGTSAAAPAAPTGGEFTGRCMVHLDAFCWVQRDSYLPQGNQGLKAVTKAKLGYDPVEVDPEDMVRYAVERPSHMASYSVSDAVATYYLYTTYVHNFIFSMSTIIPMAAEDVLRKGSGTLCESLLMVEAYRNNIVCPNKQVDPLESFYNGHLLESETYIGGHVECLEAGVFRADIPCQFTLVPSALQSLIDHVDRDLTFAIEVENGLQRCDVVNYECVKQEIVTALEMLRDSPYREEPPMIYHLDVGAMYPNIILTNRLQPSAIVSHSECAACEFNKAENNCKRPMTWTWRGDYSPASMSDYRAVQRQLSYDKPSALTGVSRNSAGKLYSELPEKEQARLAKARLKDFSAKAYHKTKVTTSEDRVDTVCMRENSFYVDTVRAFRDRRYDYKLLTKTWKARKNEAEQKGDAIGRKNADDKAVLMDSLQLAHKCILNSFYGYVMRKGARWRSMEMAGIVTYTGAHLIMQARELVEQVGRPLELDTDGIWCILPSSFPQNYKFELKNGKRIALEYPCAMLNADVADRYTNHQYQNLVQAPNGGSTKKYAAHSECSIFFELDGPYKAMVLPASPEEGKLLKKKYAVFNFDGTLAELKGFELKRRGELELVKIFQSQVFEHFLNGNTLKEVYDAVGAVGNQWLDVLDSRGIDMDDTELLELISEKKTISKTVDDYEGRKATSLTTAFRLADFLGAEMVKDKGLNCNLIISHLPAGAPTTERAIPVAIFAAETAVKEFYLRKWLKDPQLNCDDFRDVVDWEYYKERLGKSIQKIITIPAGLQRVSNPCDRVEHPVWLQRTLLEALSGQKQQKITALFKKKSEKGPGARSAALIVKGSAASGEEKAKSDVTSADIIYGRGATNGIVDIEDMAGNNSHKRGAVVHSRKKGTESIVGMTKEHSITPEESILAVPPMMDVRPQTSEELNSWLDRRKALWNKLKRDRQSRRKEDDDNFDGGRNSKRTSGVAAMVRNAAQLVEKAVWQIFELQETDQAGLFVVWAMTGRAQLQRLHVTIPRLLYVNCLGKDACDGAVAMGGKLTKRDLPHLRPSTNLFAVSLSEKRFLRNEKALGLFLSDPQVEGVYGSKTPLLFRGVLNLGCMARVIQSESGAGTISKPYRLADLKLVERGPVPYLDNRVATFRRIFMYHAVDNNKPNTQGITGLFIIEGNNSEKGMESTIPEIFPREGSSKPLVAKVYVWLSQPAGVAGRPAVANIFRQLSPESTSCRFVTAATSSVAEAVSACNEKLSDYLREKKGPTVVIVQASGGIIDARHWRKQFSLLQEFPLLIMPANSQDGDFPALLWQPRITRIMLQRFLFFPAWYEDRLKSARFAQVPIGNLGTDAMMSMIDVLFARQLEHNKHILWAANGPLPDLGGSESDEVSVWSESLSEPHISEPGVYRNLCVELEIFGLAVAAIMTSGMLDAQGLTTSSVGSGVLGASESSNIASSAHDAACARSFSLLKALVAKWIHDVGVSADAHADAILQSLYRFLCGHNGQSLLHDPALHRVVYDLMGRLFMKFIGEFKKLGVNVVYADFYKIIVHTNKYDVSSANEYLQFIISAVTNKELFRYLQVNVKVVYEQLIWLSPVNYSGIPLWIHRHSESMEDSENEGIGDLPNHHDLINTTENPLIERHIAANRVESKDNSTFLVHASDEEDADNVEEDYSFLDEINREASVSASRYHERHSNLDDERSESDDNEDYSREAPSLRDKSGNQLRGSNLTPRYMVSLPWYLFNVCILGAILAHIVLYNAIQVVVGRFLATGTSGNIWFLLRIYICYTSSKSFCFYFGISGIP